MHKAVMEELKRIIDDSEVCFCLFVCLFKEDFSVLMLCVCVYIYIQQLNSFRALPTLWCINLTVATCHIQYTFLGSCFFHEKTNKTRNT